MATLVFGSTGNVGQYICSRLRGATPLTRDHYDMSKPDDFSGMELFSDIKCIIWCSGMNTNDALGTLNARTYGEVMDVNVNSIVKTLDYFTKTNKLSRGARICILSSILQDRGRANKLSYCISKSAIGGLVRAASATLQEGDILINAILPGPIDNEMTKRTLSAQEYDSLKSFFVNPEDIYKMCCLLCFKNTSITGQSIHIDNGISAKITY